MRRGIRSWFVIVNLSNGYLSVLSSALLHVHTHIRHVTVWSNSSLWTTLPCCAGCHIPVLLPYRLTESLSSPISQQVKWLTRVCFVYALWRSVCPAWAKLRQKCLLRWLREKCKKLPLEPKCSKEQQQELRITFSLWHGGCLMVCGAAEPRMVEPFLLSVGVNMISPS